MDYIHKVKKDKRRFLGISKSKSYQTKKENTVLDFLFWQKKQNKKKKLNEFELKDIEKYLKTKKYWSASTKKERKAILNKFYKRNNLG